MLLLGFRSGPARSGGSRWWSLALLAGHCGGWAGLAPDPATAAEPGIRRALVIVGLPGDAEHRARYAAATEKLVQALVDRCGFAAGDVWVRFGVEATAGDGPAVRGSRGLSTRATIAADAEAIRQAAPVLDALWVIVLGHGHFDGRRSHLNLPGPDLADGEFARLFEGIAAREQVFIVTTSASGFFLKPLASAGRVAIAATEADREVNETIYPLALADTLAAPPAEADRDQDGAVSVFELYLAVAAEVARRYDAAELIATEHAQLDDNGDGRASEPQATFPPPKSPPAAPPPPAPPRLGPRDDGFLAAQIRAIRPEATRSGPGPGPGPGPLTPR